MKRPLLRYFGGKYRIAKWIISHFPEHRIYVEPYGGAASVLLRKEPCYAEVYNDIDDSCFALFTVLKCEKSANELQRLLEVTPFSRREFELAHVYHPDNIERARRLIIRSFMGFGADSCTNLESKTGFRAVNKKTGSTGANDWINYPAQIPLFVNRLKGVTIEHADAFRVMKDHDTEDTLHYVDPPYPTDTRRGGRYKHELTMQEHQDLADFLQTLKGTVIISGYDHDIYNNLGWQKVTKETRADKAGKRLECLWISKPRKLQPEAEK